MLDAELAAVQKILFDLKPLLDKLRLHLSPIQFRETLTALVGWKVARIVLIESSILVVVPELRKHGFAVTFSEDSYIHKPDIGKGGWSNTVAEIILGGGKRGDYYVYIARNEPDMLAAIEADGQGHSDDFGRFLSIPTCCRQNYVAFSVNAHTVQNDCTPMTALNTHSQPPHLGWNNIAAQYFGYSLISFAPCSLECAAAQNISQAVYNLLWAYDSRFAKLFFDSHHSNIIYSEYQGIHRLRASQWNSDGELLYQSDEMDSTAQSRLSEALAAGSRIRFIAPQFFEIYGDDSLIARWDSSELAFFLCGQ